MLGLVPLRHAGLGGRQVAPNGPKPSGRYGPALVLDARAASVALAATAPRAASIARWNPAVAAGPPSGDAVLPAPATPTAGAGGAETAGWPPHEATTTVTARRESSERVRDIIGVIGSPADRH